MILILFPASSYVKIITIKMTYNLTLVLRSTLKDADRKKLLDNIKSLFGKAKIAEKDWGQKALAYPIKKLDMRLRPISTRL